MPRGGKKIEKRRLPCFASTTALFALLIFTAPAFSGNLEPPAGPDSPDSAMYTIDDIYNYLDTGVAGTKRTGGFVEPTAPPNPTGHTLDDVHAKVGERCITCDGTLSPEGRWCDNLNGTVTDMETGLVWLQKADWGGTKPWRDSSTYDDAHTRAGLLYAGASGANLSDGSVVGDWRLPTKTELVGITQGTEYVRSATPRMFTGVHTYFYWSSTTFEGYTYVAWHVDMYDGYVFHDDKGYYDFCVWPVRADN